MLKRRRPSLDAVCAAVLAARHGSMSKAAQVLCVSPSAVSHKVRKLENELGIALFDRHANFLRLTDTGRSFLVKASEAIAMIDEAAAELQRDANEVLVRASSSFAVRWLIPALEHLSNQHPEMRIQVKTMVNGEPLCGPWDLLIDYRRQGESQVGERLASDLVLPLVSPKLAALSRHRAHRDIRPIPALRCTSDDWDWTLWCRLQAIESHSITIGHAFDTDDAAIRGATAGMGMVLASPLLTQTEIRHGTLVPLPGFEPVELGRYEVRVSDNGRRAVRRFNTWLLNEIRMYETESLIAPSLDLS